MLIKRLSRYAGIGVISLIGFFGSIEKAKAEDSKVALQDPPKTEQLLVKEKKYEDFIPERFFEHMERRLQERLPFQYLTTQNPFEMRDFVRGIVEKSAMRALNDYANQHPFVLGIRDYTEGVLERVSDGALNGTLSKLRINLSNRADDSGDSLEEVVYDVKEKLPFEKKFRLKLGIGVHPYLGAGYRNVGLRVYHDGIGAAFNQIIFPKKKIHFELGARSEYEGIEEPEVFARVARRDYGRLEWGIHAGTKYDKNTGKRNSAVLIIASVNF